MVFLTTSVEESKYGQPKKETVIKIFYRLYTFCLPAGERERERERERGREREREGERGKEGGRVVGSEMVESSGRRRVEAH
jgi:hypothetical protein